MADPDTPALAHARRRRRWWSILAAVSFVLYVPMYMVNFPGDVVVFGVVVFTACRADWWHGWIAGRLDDRERSHIV
jgi:hypothetical protein